MDGRRLVLENRAMVRHYGEGPQLCKGRSGKVLYWDYTIHQEGNSLPIKIAYPGNYPASPPQIITTAKLPDDTPHIMPGKSLLPGKKLCWHYPGDKRQINSWDPGRDTAALCVSVAKQWFLAFLIWYSTPDRSFEDWPIPDAVNA